MRLYLSLGALLGPLIGCLAIFQDYYNRLADVLKAINDYYESRGAAV